MLDLDADRLVLLATDSIERSRVAPADEPEDAPDFSEGAVELLQATLVDPLMHDVRMLGKINLLAVDGGGSSGVDRYQEARGKRPYRPIPYMFVAPSSRGALGRCATEVFRDRYGGLKGLRSPDFALLTRLLGGAGHSHGELLSYLFFEREFVDSLIEMGRSDATSWLERVDGPGGAVVPRSRGPAARGHGVVRRGSRAARSSAEVEELIEAARLLFTLPPHGQVPPAPAGELHRAGGHRGQPRLRAGRGQPLTAVELRGA
ncbi:MAG: hypothetical protein WKF31_11845 [Thermoleophilaceae bacterium]